MLELVTAADVRAAIETTLQAWLPWTLAEVCEHAGQPRTHLPAPAADEYFALHDAAELEKIPTGRRLVHVATVVPDGTFVGAGKDQRARWSTVVNVMSKGVDHADTVAGADLYRAAVRIVLHQHQDLGGLASATEVTRTSYRPVGSSARLLLSSVVEATVTTDHATPIAGSPAAPPADPSQPTTPAPETTSVDVWVDRDRPEE